MSAPGQPQQRPQSPEPAEPAEWLPPIDSPQPTDKTAAPNGPAPADRPADASGRAGRSGRRRRRRAADPLLEDRPRGQAAGPPGRFLEVRDLRVQFPTHDGLVRSVDGLSFGLERGRTLGIVGESGSGKSVTSLAIMGLHEKTGAAINGEIWLDGEELLGMTSEQVRRRRGKKMAMIFQDPLSSLHPYYTVGDQIVEAYRINVDATKKQARRHAIDMLDRVGIR